MDFLESIHLIDALHQASSGLLIPTVVILVLLMLFSLYSIGSIVIEAFCDRRAYKAHIPQLIARIDEAPNTQVAQIIGGSALLPAQKVDLLDFLDYLNLPLQARTQVAKQLLAKQEKRYSRRIVVTDIASKIAPMFGLMGTLIPLGPGLIALGTGEVSTLSQSLIVAFDTTVAGLATAAVCYVISLLRRRWYEEYLSGLEALICTLLEKAQLEQEGAQGECAHVAGVQEAQLSTGEAAATDAPMPAVVPVPAKLLAGEGAACE